MSSVNINLPNNDSLHIMCPSIIELSTIRNQVKCNECNIMYCNESQYQMHHLKVHQKKNLVKKKNTHYHCPIKNCIYALGNNQYFTLHKYLKQHFLKVHAEKKFTCSQCSKSFSTNAAKEAHHYVCGFNFICECLKTFNSYEALLTHAKRHSHYVDKKNNLMRSKKKKVKENISLCSEIYKNQTIYSENKYIVPRVICNTSVQTENITLPVGLKKDPSCINLNNKICRHTQTIDNFKEKKIKKSIETQTTVLVSQLIRPPQIKNKNENIIDQDLKIQYRNLNNLNSSTLILLEEPSVQNLLDEIWEQKSDSETRTKPEKYLLGDIENYSLLNATYNEISRSDPILTEKFYSDKFNSIETQTEKENCISIFESDSLNSKKSQASENFTDSLEPLHFFSNTYTQTCDEILYSDLNLSNIQTQTTWGNEDERIETNHMETQTDLFNIFQDLE